MTESTSLSLGRRNHYSSFYGAPVPEGLALVLGNCQAESLRIVIDGPDLPTVRIPPVHELEASDLPHLDRLLSRASLVITQPIRDDYRDLPVGTRQVRERIASTARLVIVPAVRHRSLYPAQVVVRHPDRPIEDPPIAPYHDLRTIAEALGNARPRLRPDMVAAIAEESTAALRLREDRSGAVRISDVFDRPRFDLLRTLNHPGNPVWETLARRVRAEVGLADTVTDPGRALLASVIAPREEVVIETWGLDDAPDPHWYLGGRAEPADEVRDAHLRWYADNPDLLRLAADRHAAALEQVMSA
ncbi:WcbI family polysaccharide biosynthesis putative acetyltransferase [Labedella endophytica]|uniref:Peptide ABC transporter ATPase n=1 Tax=Labedella endophytica TaxID=1523160 RepID=A0A433JP82_9MICO|nr:WcbI family polysaccharide biosynthesis putative acetyltransferase [Labedella endophytica]RUQ98275.1 peptide ABC transporter ATPase [Labedella endophytica]